MATLCSVRAPLAALALLAPLAAPALHGTAAADPWAGHITGSGTYTPGLSNVCTPQTVTFDGTLVINASSHAGTYDFSFNGNTIGCATIARSAGAGNLNGDLAGALTYVREGLFLEARGRFIQMGASQESLYAACHWQPTSIIPTTGFNLHCVATQQQSGNAT